MIIIRTITIRFGAESPGLYSRDMGKYSVFGKRGGPAGTVLDGEGGYCTYGLLEKTAVAREENLLPLGLSQDAVVTRGIPEDGMVRWDDVTLPDSEVLELWEQQENKL